MNLIGVDYGIRNDIPTVIVIRKNEDKLEVVETCKVEDFDYTKYVASVHQIVGEKVDLEKFQVYLKRGKIL